MRFIIGFLTLVLSSISFAATPIDGLYMSIFGGVTYLPDNVDSYHNGYFRTNANYNSGWDSGGSIGFKGNHLRYEAEVTYLQAQINHFSLNGVRQIYNLGYSNAALAMANVYYDFCEIIPAFEPYLGAGIGYGWVRAKLNTPLLPRSDWWKGDDSVFAFQGKAGLTYNFAENYALFIEYRYVFTETGNNLGKHFQAHMGNLGAVYRFELSKYK